MREIKFRAWDKKDKIIMQDVYMCRVNMELVDFKRSMEGPRWTVNMECEDIVLMQYTGLKDKNSKEIYEGDIVKMSHGSLSKVYFSGGSFQVDVGGALIGLRLDYLGRYKNKFIEVIGNIYENPDLVNKKK